MGIIDLPSFLAIVAVCLGATVGSFLNVVIYRLPRDISVNTPRRSFCPSCKYKIPFYFNIPIISWILLWGKCKNCKRSIPFRYCFVELLTALLFLMAWLSFGRSSYSNFSDSPELVVVAWVFLALLIAASFVDIEHQIIPDIITKGGTGIGIMSALFVPAMAHKFMGIKSSDGSESFLSFYTMAWSVVGVVVGFVLLYSIVLLGKLAFGRKRIKSNGEGFWEIVEGEENPILITGEERIPFEDLFFVGSERIVIQCNDLEINGEANDSKHMVIKFDRLAFGVEEMPIEDWKTLRGKAKKITYYREAMGFGDVKFMCLLGAFLGWKGVLFTVFSASVLGTAINLPSKILGKTNAFSRLPFGPYLALGAVAWLFIGTDLLNWYFSLMRVGLN